MTATLLNTGVYDAHEVAHLLGGRHVEQIIRWSTADAKGNSPMVAPSHGRSFSFVDLVSLAVVAEVCRRQVPEVDVRHGIQALVDEYGFERPLSHQNVIQTLATSGASFLANLKGGWFDIGKGGQGAFEQIVRVYLRTLSYDDLGVAAIWRPTPYVVLDPRIQAGAPCVEGTRIPTSTIHELLDDETPEELAEEYGLTVEQIEAADHFEQRLSDGIGLVA